MKIEASLNPNKDVLVIVDGIATFDLPKGQKDIKNLCAQIAYEFGECDEKEVEKAVKAAK